MLEDVGREEVAFPPIISYVPATSFPLDSPRELTLHATPPALLVVFSPPCRHLSYSSCPFIPPSLPQNTKPLRVQQKLIILVSPIRYQPAPTVPILVPCVYPCVHAPQTTPQTVVFLRLHPYLILQLSSRLMPRLHPRLQPHLDP